MSNFNPNRHTRLLIEQATYTFMPHPLFPFEDEVYAIEGGEAVIYQVRNLATKSVYALKVSKPSYRGEHIARAAAALAPYRHIPGLALANRTCLTRAKHRQLINEYPDLEYAILMPWLHGKTWAGLLLDKVASERYTPALAHRLALAAAQVLWHLEAHHLAHTDIAGGNIMLSSDLSLVELLDIEGLYMPGAPTPPFRSQGSPGYQHQHLDSRGQWRPEGDRFAGAMLIAEMLAWVDYDVRRVTPRNAETLFQPQELQGQQQTERWMAVRNALWRLHRPVLSLFDQAWASVDVAQCPDLGAWAEELLKARVR